MKSNHKKSLGWLFATSLLIGSAAWAAQPVTVTNPGFEDSASGTPDGWTDVNGGATAFTPSTDSYDPLTKIPDGSNVASVFGGAAGDGISQVLAATLQADATYELSVQVGDPADFAFDGYTIQLLVDGNVLAGDDNTQAPADGDFTTATATYVYDVGDVALVGQPLEIRLLGKGLSNGDVNFDDVQLTVALADPAANAGGPYSVSLAGSLSLDGSGSLPSDGQTITTWEWDLDNNGTYDLTGVTPASISSADLESTYGMILGPNTIKLRVTDDSTPSPKTSTTEGTVTLMPPVSTFSSSAVRPTFDGADIGYFNPDTPSTAPSQDKWFYENSGAGRPKGQTFTITQNVLIKAVSYRLRSTRKAAVNNYLVRIGTFDTATNTFSELHSETFTQSEDWNPTGAIDSFGTWTFASPVTLCRLIRRPGRRSTPMTSPLLAPPIQIGGVVESRILCLRTRMSLRVATNTRPPLGGPPGSPLTRCRWTPGATASSTSTWRPPLLWMPARRH